VPVGGNVVRRIFLVGLFLLGLAVSSIAGSFALPDGPFSVSAGGTFLQQSSNDNCSFITATAQCISSPSTFFQPTVIDLTGLEGVQIGDLLSITVSGSMCFYSLVCNAPPTIGGIFSSTNSLLSSNNANRVPNAVGTQGSDNQNPVTTSTYFALNGSSVSAVNNTNPLDFGIPTGSTTMVHVTAEFLFLGVLDSFYADNSGTISVSITDTHATTVTPEPASYLLVLGGFGALALARKLFA
jgi:hypothetical protein